MAIYKSGGYKRGGVVYQGPTKPRGRPLKVVAVTTPSTSTLSKTTKKAVNKLIKNNQETKYASQLTTAQNVEIAGSGLVYDGDQNLRGWCSGFLNPAGIIPSIPQGVGEAGRVGNKIMPKALILKYFLQALPTTEANAAAAAFNTNPFLGVPFRVRVIIFRHRYAIDDYSQGNILNLGNTNGGIGSELDNLFRPYNKDEYQIVYSKTHKMASIKHNTYTDAAGTFTTRTENVPNGGLTFISKSVKVKLPKHLLYNDNATNPANINYFMAVSIHNEDNSVIAYAPAAIPQKRVKLNAEVNFTYYDS